MPDHTRTFASALLTTLLVQYTASANGPFANFQYAVDRFEIAGNLPGGAADDFDDGVVAPWLIEEPSVTESGGFLELAAPGVVGGPFNIGGLTIYTERSSVRTPDPSGFDVVDGAGSFVATATWTAVPADTNTFYGMELWIYSALHGEQGISLNVMNLDPVMAQALGVETGPGIWFADPDISGTTQFVPIPVEQITGPLLLRMTFFDLTNQLWAAFSTDGGATFDTTSFTPIAAYLNLADDVDWYLEAEALRRDLPGDLDADGDVDFDDLNLLLASYNIDANGDLDGDGDTDFDDLNILLANYGA